jgi:hypothetical protein
MEKKLFTIAETVCSITRNQGATEAAMVDHDMNPKTQAWFGWTISSRVSHFSWF